MKIIIAPQAFKGTLSARDAAKAIGTGASRAFPSAKIMLCPVSDGGDGTLDILLDAIGGKRHHAMATNALGEKKLVKWGTLHDPSHHAIIESARICGLSEIPKNKLNPMTSTTLGVGETILAALDAKQHSIFIGLGGSATNDGGTGAAKALGVHFLDASGVDLPAGGAALERLDRIDISGLDQRLRNVELIAGCDVANPLLGPNGSAAIYGPQKGATPEMVGQLDKGLTRFAAVIKKQFGLDIRNMPYGGAAGGTAAGLHALLGAQLVSGGEWVLNEIGFNKIITGANLVIVGEGRMDAQTANHKTPWTVAQAAKALNIPVLAVVGSLGKGYEILLNEGIDAIMSVEKHSIEDIAEKGTLLLMKGKTEE